jgi:hypothetical protein
VASMSRRTRAARGSVTITVAAGLILATVPGAASAAVPTAPGPLSGRYVVTLAQKPLATYQGGVAGLAATKPARGAKVDVAGADAQRYRGFLDDTQNTVAASVGVRPATRYSVATNGFTATLSGAQALKLRQTPGVMSVTKDELRKPADDHNSADFLGLSGNKGLWSALGGTANAGKGVVIGDIDTGIWPESRSFAAPALGEKPPTDKEPYRPYQQGTTTVMRKADGSTFTGTCQPGERFDASLCNQKLVGARYFGDGWLSAVPPEKRADYLSPRDGQGHGTHTASTAAGNAKVAASVDNVDFGDISGVAPGAVVSVYKALWEGKDAASTGGFTGDIVAAIDQAVADGVDVINYSVGGVFESAADDPIQLAFLSAASAGIFVSTAGGNSGPDASTLDNTAPWETTVAASTVAPFTGTVVLGDGTKYTGISTSVTSTVGPKPVVLSTAVKTAAASASDAALCMPNSLDAALVAGKIVTCDRGVNARVEKSAEVKRAGGAGMVLVNLSDSSLDADFHSVPTVHINTPDSVPFKAYAATAGAQVTLLKGGTGVPYPQVAAFSSRGPSLSGKGDLLKPDISAPGVSILAAVAPPTNSGRNFDFLSGTSMATPHISGLAALYLGKFPTMSPMQVKSAMMTTAADTKTASGAASTDVFAQGSGEVTPARMFNPGLVYDSSDVDWLGYLEGVGVATGTGVPAIDPSDYNAPSIAIGELLGSQTVTRTVTAVTPGLYRATISVPGVKATVTPSILNFGAAGQTKQFKVTFTQDTANSGSTVTGALTWAGAGTTVRSPIALTPRSALAPADVTGAGTSGEVTFPVTPGFAKFPIAAYGLASGPPQAGTVSASTGNPADQEHDYTFAVAPGTKALQFSAKTDNPAATLGMVLVRVAADGRQELVGISDLLTADARLSLSQPAPGNYLAAVITLGDAAGTTSTPYHFQHTAISAKDKLGTFTVSPANPKATPGKPLDVTASWAGANAGTRYVGYVEYPHAVGTVVTIN